jgi:hypothetical protein
MPRGPPFFSGLSAPLVIYLANMWRGGRADLVDVGLWMNYFRYFGLALLLLCLSLVEVVEIFDAGGK